MRLVHVVATPCRVLSWRTCDTCRFEIDVPIAQVGRRPNPGEVHRIEREVDRVEVRVRKGRNSRVKDGFLIETCKKDEVTGKEDVPIPLLRRGCRDVATLLPTLPL